MKATCEICPKACSLKEGQLGICKGRVGKNGKVVSKNYGEIVSMGIDSIEKKPLNNYMPESKILSVGTYGCNFHCDFCQNYIIAASDGADLEKNYIIPEELGKMAEELKSIGNIGVAYTYNEPLIAYEYVLKSCKIVHKKSMKNILVTNGYINREPFENLLPYIDALNIDLKTFNKDYYKYLGGDLDIVLDNIKLAAKYSHLELTNLIVPERNDSEEEMKQLASWISEISPEIPLHISRFFPAYKMYDASPTPVEKIYSLVKIAKRYLKYVYAGNC